MIKGKVSAALGMALYVWAGTAWAQSSPSAETNIANHALGASVGWIVGTGLSYRHYVSDQYFQTSVFAAAEQLNDDIASNDDVYVDLAFSYGRYLHVDLTHKWVPIGLKWLAGAEWIYEESPNCDYDPATQGCIANSRTDRTVHIGTGVGIDVGRVRSQGLIMSLDLSFIATFEEGKFEGVHAPWPAFSVLYNW